MTIEFNDAAGAYSIWTGPSGGYYEKVGQALAYSAGHRQLNLVAVTSNGSVQNICALAQRKADFALVQSDAAHLAWYGEQPFRKKYYPAVQLVSPLFVEKVHVLTRPHLYAHSPAGLTRPKSIWMGPADSGTELSAQLVLRASGKNEDEITALKASPPPANFSEAMDRLRTRELDAVFQTEVAPAKNVADELNDTTSEIRLLGFDWSSVELLVQNRMYIETSLQKTEYPQMEGAIYTVGVEALLLTRNDVDEDAVTKLAEMLEDNGGDVFTHLQRIIAKDSGLNVDPGVESRLSRNQTRKLIEPQSLSLLGVQVPDFLLVRAHPKAKGYLWTFRLPKEAAVRIGLLAIILLLVGAAMFHPGSRPHVKTKFVYFLIGYVVVLAIGGAWLQAVEGGLNEGFTTLTTSCLSLGKNVLSNLPGSPVPSPTPTTQYGGYVMKWFSWILVGLFTWQIFPALKKLVSTIKTWAESKDNV